MNRDEELLALSRSWEGQLAMVCFLEDLDPDHLPISVETRSAVRAGLKVLRSQSSLYVTAACLDSVRHD